MCDVGYLCANFSLPRPPFSRLRPDVCERQTDRRHTNRRQTSDSILDCTIRGEVIIMTIMLQQL